MLVDEFIGRGRSQNSIMLLTIIVKENKNPFCPGNKNYKANKQIFVKGQKRFPKTPFTPRP